MDTYLAIKPFLGTVIAIIGIGLVWNEVQKEIAQAEKKKQQSNQ